MRVLARNSKPDSKKILNLIVFIYRNILHKTFIVYIMEL